MYRGDRVHIASFRFTLVDRSLALTHAARLDRARQYDAKQSRRSWTEPWLKREKGLDGHGGTTDGDDLDGLGGKGRENDSKQ